MLTAYLVLLVAVLCWSGNFIAGKFALRAFPPFALACLRIWLSAALLAAIYFTLPNRRRLTRADLKKFAELGLYGVALNQAGFTIGLNYTTVAHSALIISLSPIFVLLLARWQRLEALTPRKLLGMGLAFLGVVILTSEHGLGSSSPTFLGDAITLAAALAFSLYTVTGEKVAHTYDTLTLNTFAYLTGAVLVVPLAGWQLRAVAWS
ncbi:MAG: DMT family transporter, partial [Terriglobia bacterium]